MANKRTYKKKPTKIRRNSRKNKIVKQSRKFLGGVEDPKELWGLYQVTDIDPDTREPKFTLLEISNKIEKFDRYKNDETYKIEQLNKQSGGVSRKQITSIDQLPDGEREDTSYIVEYKPFPSVITRIPYKEPKAVEQYISKRNYYVYQEVFDTLPSLFTRTIINSIDELPTNAIEGTRYKINSISNDIASSLDYTYLIDPIQVKEYLLKPSKYRVYKEVTNSLSNTDLWPKKLI